MAEVWKDITGYEGLYQVSNLGRVKSLPRLVSHKTNGKMKVKGCLLKPQTFPNGYLFVRLYKNQNSKRFSLHRLVASQFIDNPKGLPIVMHKDDNKENNAVFNLKWGTQRDNMSDMIKKGRKLVAENSPNAKLTNEDAAHVRQMHGSGMASLKKIGILFGISKKSVLNIVQNKTYNKNVTCYG